MHGLSHCTSYWHLDCIVLVDLVSDTSGCTLHYLPKSTANASSEAASEEHAALIQDNRI